MTITDDIAARYTRFADQEAAGVSATFEAWARAVADDPQILAMLAELPIGKRQPNLVFAAARLHGAAPGDRASLHDILADHWQSVRSTILERSTQTNEAARCGAIILGLEHVHGPIALLEVGSAAGLCLVPDRYSYTFTHFPDAAGDAGRVVGRLDPIDGPSALTIPISLHGSLRPPTRMPDIVWRAGLDLSPLDPSNGNDRDWLEALVWPEHDERRDRLAGASAIAARAEIEQHRGDLLTDLQALADQAPANATLVVTHSATLAYLDADRRVEAVDAMTRTSGRRISFEGRGVDRSLPSIGAPITPTTLFIAALDGRPYALADGHGSHLHPVPVPPVAC